MMEAGNCHVLYMRVALCVVVLFCDLLRVLLVVRSHYQTHRDCGQVETFLQSVSASLSPCLHLFATLPTFPCSCRMHIENEVKLDFKVSFSQRSTHFVLPPMNGFSPCVGELSWQQSIDAGRTFRRMSLSGPNVPRSSRGLRFRSLAPSPSSTAAKPGRASRLSLPTWTRLAPLRWPRCLPSTR